MPSRAAGGRRGRAPGRARGLPTRVETARSGTTPPACYPCVRAARAARARIPLMVEHAVGDAVALSVDAVGANVGAGAVIRALADPGARRRRLQPAGAALLLLLLPACSSAPATPRPRSISRAWPAARPPPRCARSASQDKRHLARCPSWSGWGGPSAPSPRSSRTASRSSRRRLRVAHRAGHFECFGWQHWSTAATCSRCGRHLGTSRAGRRAQGDAWPLANGRLICDCARCLELVLEQFAAAGRGVCMDVRQPEGRGLRLDRRHTGRRPAVGWLDPACSAERWEQGIAAQIFWPTSASATRACCLPRQDDVNASTIQVPYVLNHPTCT